MVSPSVFDGVSMGPRKAPSPRTSTPGPSSKAGMLGTIDPGATSTARRWPCLRRSSCCFGSRRCRAATRPEARLPAGRAGGGAWPPPRRGSRRLRGRQGVGRAARRDRCPQAGRAVPARARDGSDRRGRRARCSTTRSSAWRDSPRRSSPPSSHASGPSWSSRPRTFPR